MPTLKALELEQFQSFSDTVRLEFAPITLLYGPNSAGKSAVYDALELLRRLWDPVAYDEKLVLDMVQRWTRSAAGARKPLRLAVEFECAFSELDPQVIWDDDNNWRGLKQKSSKDAPFFSPEEEELESLLETKATSPLLVRLDFQAKQYVKFEQGIEVQLSEKDLGFHVSAMGIHINGKPILTFGSFSEDSLNVSDIIMDEAARSATLDGSIFTHRELISLEAIGGIRVTTAPAELPDLRLTSFSSKRAWDEGLHEIARHTIFANALGDMTFFIGTLFGKVFRDAPPLVHADRGAPSEHDAVVIIYPIDFTEWDRSDHCSPDSPARLLSERALHADPYVPLLARAAHAALLHKAVVEDLRNMDDHEPLWEITREDARIAQRINEHLETHLFREKLYRLECASMLMAPITDCIDALAWEHSFLEPAAVRIFVRDHKGRKLDLRDVGSGIPYVLPVLYAAAKGLLARIQQPELHLHPALQSELADVFIAERNVSSSKVLIIETHSEHVLLRLLKRIRDTDKGSPSSATLPLLPNDVAIYYFDPQVDDRTFVLKQPVTPTGDFYYEWPRGFFSERDGDLFE